VGMLSEENFLTAVRWLLKLFFGARTSLLIFILRILIKRDRANRLDHAKTWSCTDLVQTLFWQSRLAMQLPMQWYHWYVKAGLTTVTIIVYTMHVINVLKHQKLSV